MNLTDNPNSRIAPTPSGFIHLGNAYNFLFTYLLVLQTNGSLRLRIDDLDAPRMRPDFIQDIFDSLHWLGITWDKGPMNLQEHEIFSQQHRLKRYRDLLDKLVNTGTVFACTCSRKDIISQSRDGQYPGTCRYKDIPLDTPQAAWRVLTPEQTTISFTDMLAGQKSISLNEVNRDFIIRRRDGIPAYPIASLADDLADGVKLIVRGEDLLESTASQLYLAGLAGENEFEQARFYHHPLLSDEKGKKLSKSAGSTSIHFLRLHGSGPEAIYRNFAGWLLTQGMEGHFSKEILQALLAGTLVHEKRPG